MKLTIKADFWRGRKCVKATAVISPNKKLGITKRHQKTFRVMTVAPIFTAEHVAEGMIRPIAERWEQSILNPAPSKPPTQETLL